ncbi:MAG: ATP-grasp domain-containing protein [Alicyclobacillus sp.]|nr:ATP-grasp domain-containing protein [Alicyclobacillus sp.]
MRTVVFLHMQKHGSSREAIQAAERLGYYTVVLTNRPTLVAQRSEFPDVHRLLAVDLDHLASLMSHLQSLQEEGLELAAIVSFVDPYVSRAALLARRFCPVRPRLQPILTMEDKVRTRKTLTGTPYNPWYAVLDRAEDLNLWLDQVTEHLPLVVKAPRSTGAKDVHVVCSKQQLAKRVHELIQLYPGLPVLAEEYVSGPQYLVEVLAVQDTVHPVALVEQHITLHRGHPIVDGYALSASPPTQRTNSLISAVTDIVQRIGLRSGPCHLELRQNSGQWKLIEANPRIAGGAMNRMIAVGLGINLVQETLKLALGEQPDLTPLWRKNVYTHYVSCTQAGTVVRVVGKQKALNCPGVEAVYVKPRKGQKVRPPTSLGQRCAYVMASDPYSLDKARRVAVRAASCLQFQLAEEGAP